VVKGHQVENPAIETRFVFEPYGLHIVDYIFSKNAWKRLLRIVNYSAEKKKLFAQIFFSAASFW